MMTQAMNTKKNIVSDYLKKYPLTTSTPLGVNVSEILELAKKQNCKPSELSELIIKKV